MTPVRTEVDLVVQGGVTSGVVFPSALYELSKDFHFVRIGGTSAGAIAAAMLAAAECQRRSLIHQGTSDDEAQAPFETLRQLGERLADPLLAQDPEGPRVLEGLFAPDPATEALYLVGRAALTGQPKAATSALLTWWSTRRNLEAFLKPLQRAGLLNLVAGQAERWGWGEALAPLLGRGLPNRPPVAGWLITAIVGLVLLIVGLTALLSQVLPGLWATAAAALLALLLTAGLVLWRVVGWIGLLTQAGREFGAAVQPLGSDLLGTLNANQFGLATGYGTGEAYRLTPWLHRSLQNLVGDPEGVLTFGQLRERGIELKLVTSCLSRRRPYVLPLDQRTDDFQNMYFRPDEWCRFFPDEVLVHLIDRASRMYMDPDQPAPDTQRGWSYYRLPTEADLPVLVATRLSMSFPVLFSALPLHYSQRDTSGLSGYPRRRTRRIRTDSFEDKEEPVRIFPLTFSDGGLTSNFPLMLFDAPLPKRLLLALNLQYRQENQDPFLAGERPWRPYNTPITSMEQFGQSIFETAQQWFDQSLMGLSGYGERTVNITLKRGEGGLNLSMNAQTIAFLAFKGTAAGRLLGERFRNGGTHQWNQQGLVANQWRAVVTDLGELLTDYVKMYPRKDLERALAAMPRQSNGLSLRPNFATLDVKEERALRALELAACCIEKARRGNSDALFPQPTPWNVLPARELRALLRYRPLL